MKTNRRPRTSVELGESLGRLFRAYTAARGIHGSTLAYSWIAQAVRDARADRLDRVPSTAWTPRAARGAAESRIVVEYAQRPEEAAEWDLVLRSVGSTRRAVLTAYVSAYIRAHGDLIAMEPPCREPPPQRPPSTSQAA